jgi:radical SAM superfamily enzyme YgiQ (UPF0313 family)
MKICFVAPGSLTEPVEPSPDYHEEIALLAETAPIGILTLAAVLEQQGLIPRIVDLNRFFYDHLLARTGNGAENDLCAYAAARLANLGDDLYGLGTISSSYPLSIRIARELKRLRPDTIIILGGPQASVVDVPTMEAFPFIDLIVRGEAEESLPAILRALAGRSTLDSIRGVTYRCGDRVLRNPNAPVIADLDGLPVPAFHLYPEGKRGCPTLALELGRGCPFACKFCSTNDFFRRNFRLKSPHRVIEQMHFAHDAYGTINFDLIHDMFTVDRRKVAAFCHAMIDSKTSYKWYCSARTDCIDDDLIALMAAAGCDGIFFGIETGSPRLQKVIDKHLDVGKAVEVIDSTARHNMSTTASVIIGFPEEERIDIEATVDFLIDSCRHDLIKPQMHMLAALAETPLHSTYREQLVLDPVWSDFYGEAWTRDSDSRQLIAAHPDLFPNFYVLPLSGDRDYLQELRNFVLFGLTRCRWLIVALQEECRGDFLGLFDQWLQWCTDRGSVERAPAYYSDIRFADDLLCFVSESYLTKINPGSVAAAGMLRYQTALREAIDRSPNFPARGVTRNRVGQLNPLPAIAKNVLLVELDVDVIAIREALLRRELPIQMPWSQCSLAVRMRSDKRAELLQLPPLATQLLKMCDGQTTFEEIVLRMQIPDTFRSIPAEEVARLGIETLAEQQLISVMSPDG